MNKKVTKEDLENLSLKFGGDSKNVKQQQLRKQYPWLVSRDELHKELQKIEEKNVSESDKEAEVSICL